MTRFDVSALGETMLRMSVPAGVRLETASQLDVYPGGAESNVLYALARLGRRTGYVTALPQNPLGRLAANALRSAGIDLGGVVWEQGGRMGMYYVEFSAPPRPIQVTYDRADSCAARLTADAVNWDYLLDTRLLHFTGITPALSATCRPLADEMVRRARAAGVPVSFDVNFRSKLWTPAEAAPALEGLMAGADVLFCKDADARLLFGLAGDTGEVMRELARRTGAKWVIMTSGADGVRGWDGTQLLHQPALPITGIIDRLGAGDALAAGVLHGWLSGDMALGLRYGVALAALALTQYGDMVITTPAEVEALLAQAGDPIQR
jgi:2-dehydro-3-deoxygluconokinase